MGIWINDLMPGWNAVQYTEFTFDLSGCEIKNINATMNNLNTFAILMGGLPMPISSNQTQGINCSHSNNEFGTKHGLKSYEID